MNGGGLTVVHNLPISAATFAPTTRPNLKNPCSPFFGQGWCEFVFFLYPPPAPSTSSERGGVRPVVCHIFLIFPLLFFITRALRGFLGPLRVTKGYLRKKGGQERTDDAPKATLAERPVPWRWVNPKIQNAFEGASGGKSILAFHGPRSPLPLPPSGTNRTTLKKPTPQHHSLDSINGKGIITRIACKKKDEHKDKDKRNWLVFFCAGLNPQPPSSHHRCLIAIHPHFFSVT